MDNNWGQYLDISDLTIPVTDKIDDTKIKPFLDKYVKKSPIQINKNIPKEPMEIPVDLFLKIPEKSFINSLSISSLLIIFFFILFCFLYYL